MAMAIVIIVSVILFVAFIIFIAVYASNIQKKRNQALEEVAIEIGGRYEEAIPFGKLLSYAFKSKQMEITDISDLHKSPFPAIIYNFRGGTACFTYHTEGSKNEIQYTDIIIALDKPIGFKLKIVPEGFFTKIGKVFGMQDIQTGDPEFDSKYIIKSDSETEMLSLLTPNLKRLIIEMHEYKYKNIRFEISEHVEIHKIGFVQDKEEIKQYIDLSKQIANEFIPKSMNL